jgi:DNA mismatch repair protein MutS2
MDPKTLSVLEFPKILARLAEFCDFSASAELAQALQPTGDFDEALARLAETSEARRLLAVSDLTIGGAHDIREHVELAARGGILEPQDLLDVQSTLIACGRLRRALERSAEAYPRLAEIALRLPVSPALVESIGRCIADNGEVLDNASPKLADLRRQVRVAHDRLMARLQRYLTDTSTAAKLQDAVITQRDGRYVIPLRAEFKGQVKAIVHDQSSTGATLFIEPLAVVELNNAYREAQIAEREEIRRILTALSIQVGEMAGEIAPGITALAQLDLAFAKAKYADEIHASEPILKPTEDRGRKTANQPRPTVKLLNARHPLLDPATVVPIQVDPAPGTLAVVITGPNTGGKTVTLKTVGLLALMAQAGLHIPAQSGSELPCFQSIFADIGDEQSIEQSLSTFSGHIKNIVGILKKADRRSLVILDELGAGTDPAEGSALARAILKELLERGATTFVATHYPELKTFAHTTPGVVNASLEFDLQTLRPTYKLTLGLPGRSNALAIAARLGLPQPIIEAARADVNPDELRADKLLGDIHRQRKMAIREREKAEKARAQARRLERELNTRLEQIETERQHILEQARAEGQLEIEVLKAQIETLKQALKQARQPLEALAAVEARAGELEEKFQQPVVKHQTQRVVAEDRPFSVGEKIVLEKLGVEGVILDLDEEQAEVQAGRLRMRVPRSELRRQAGEAPEEGGRRIPGEQPPSPPSDRPSAVSLAASPGMELDLRGQTADEALDRLDDYLDRAFLAGMPFVRIIHGKGTGKLRQVIRDALRDHPHVVSFEEGRDQEGGAGVTVAKIASD